MNKSTAFHISTLVVALISISAQAQTVDKVYWDFTSASPTSGLFTGLVVDPVTQGNNHGTTTLITSMSTSAGYTTAAGFTASGAGNAGAAAVIGALSTSTSTYLAFDVSLSAIAGVSYQISDISLGSRSTSTGPQTLSLYGSTDGFASNFSLLGSVPALASWAAEDFSGLALTLPDDGSIYSFRIYGSAGTGSPSANTANWRVDDLAVTMTSVAAVPEPSTLVLATIGGLGCLFALRRKR